MNPNPPLDPGTAATSSPAASNEQRAACNVLHFAIEADDLDRAQIFYAAVFGWRFEAWGPPDFFRIHTGTAADPGIEGALERRRTPLGHGGSRGFTCTVSVPDVRATRERIETQGGKVLFEGDIPTVGTVLSFHDSEGNVVSAMQYAEAHLNAMRSGR